MIEVVVNLLLVVGQSGGPLRRCKEKLIAAAAAHACTCAPTTKLLAKSKDATNWID